MININNVEINTYFNYLFIINQAKLQMNLTTSDLVFSCMKSNWYQQKNNYLLQFNYYKNVLNYYLKKVNHHILLGGGAKKSKEIKNLKPEGTHYFQ